MEEAKEHHRELFDKYLKNQYSEKELREVIEWLKTDQAQENTYDITHELWENIPLKEEGHSAEKIKKLQEESLFLIKRNTVRPKKRILQSFKTIYKIAAIALLLIISGSLYYLYNHHPVIEEPTNYQAFISGKGEIRKLKLPDGSIVTLNAGSKLYLPDNFNEKERNVTLDGEAFFDVTPDPQKAFHVKGTHTHIKVLGTSFNVKSYKEDHQTTVTVSSGKVMIDIEDMETRLNLTQNQHLSINHESGDFEKKTIEENLYAKWMDGVLYFEKESLNEIIRKLQRCYDKEIVLQTHNQRKVSITGTHDNKSLESVLESICFNAGLSYKEEGNKIFLTD